MTKTRVDDCDHAELLAVDALDELAGQILRQPGARVPRKFLDWVGQEGTRRLRYAVRKRMEDPAFAQAMNTPAAVEIVRRSVEGWLLRQLNENFAEESPSIREFANGRPRARNAGMSSIQGA